MKSLYSIRGIAASILLLLLCSLLSSCDSQPKQESPEVNIDVDSDIYIIPIGSVDEAYLHALVPRLEKRFTTKVHLALDKRMPDPDYAFDYEAQKHISMYIITELIKVDVPDGAKILGVANVDLFVHRSVDEFIFGQSQFGVNGKVALVSTFRMDPFSYVGGKRNDKLVVERLTKEAVHELGHLFGIRNCAGIECAMYLPKNLRELDKKTDGFCMISQQEFRAAKQSKKQDTEDQR